MIPEVTPELLRRMRRVRALLETLDGWVPSPPQGSLAESGLAPSSRVPCVDCNRSGRRKYKHQGRVISELCLSCDGRGWRKRKKGEPAFDEYSGEQIEETTDGQDVKQGKSKRQKKYVGTSYVERAVVRDPKRRYDYGTSRPILRRLLVRMQNIPELHLQYQAVKFVWLSGFVAPKQSETVKRLEAEGVAWLAYEMPKGIWVPKHMIEDIREQDAKDAA